MSRWTLLLTMVIVLGVSAMAWACPNCRDTIANTADGNTEALPAGFNYSIYWMLLGLFFAMGMVGRTIYKGLQGVQPPSSGRGLT